MRSVVLHSISLLEKLLVIAGIVLIIVSLFLPVIDFVEFFTSRTHLWYGYEDPFTLILYIGILLTVPSIFSRRFVFLKLIGTLLTSIFLTITSIRLYLFLQEPTLILEPGFYYEVSSSIYFCSAGVALLWVSTLLSFWRIRKTHS